MRYQRNERQHTAKQRASLHKFLEQLAEVLNDAGLDQHVVLSQFVVKAPWSKESAKESLWKPLEHALHGFDSTEDNTTTSYDQTYRTLVRHLSETHGVTCPPWPSEWAMSQEFAQQLYGGENN